MLIYPLCELDVGPVKNVDILMKINTFAHYPKIFNFYIKKFLYFLIESLIMKNLPF